jgi:hypothetical protein
MSRRQAPWMIFAQEGDILRTPSGDYRVIRKISRYEDGDLRSASFAIRRCSWTGRAYTVYNFTDLLKWEYAMAREPGTSRLDKKLYEETHCKVVAPPKITCCDVVGVP